MSAKKGDDIYRMDRVRERKTRDFNKVKCIKDEMEHLLVEDEIKHIGGRSILTNCSMGRMGT